MEGTISIIPNAASSEIKNDGFCLNYEGISSWLKDKGIIVPNQVLISYKDDYIWKRGGGETYISKFTLTVSDESVGILQKDIILKAIISIPIEKNLENWSKRRQELKTYKIPVSKWYWAGKGLIIEDYYLHDYNHIKDYSLLHDIARKLDMAGFNTLSFLNDIRCDINGDPYYIDFGFDLGSASGVKVNNATKYLTAVLQK